MDSEKFYYATGKERFGPVTLDELRSLALQNKFKKKPRGVAACFKQTTVKGVKNLRQLA